MPFSFYILVEKFGAYVNDLFGLKRHPTEDLVQVPKITIPADANLSPRQITIKKYWERFKRPIGVPLNHYTYVKVLGRVGFVSKGIVYAVMGGMCISTAAHLDPEVDGLQSPMGVFIYLGLFSIGTPLLIIMLIGISFYSTWRFWEGSYGQGGDKTQSAFKNFFRCRLSPIVSGCVYIVYLTYIGKLLAKTREERIALGDVTSDDCFPACWGHSEHWYKKAAVVIFGMAFLIACITQLQNVFTKRWHNDLMVHHCTRIEKWVMITLGHLGFLARAGVFMFVGVYMFKVSRHDIEVKHDSFADAINQANNVKGGAVLLWLLGIGLIFFGVFAAGNAYYKYYPTPPPHRQAFYLEDSELHFEPKPKTAEEELTAVIVEIPEATSAKQNTPPMSEIVTPNNNYPSGSSDKNPISIATTETMSISASQTTEDSDVTSIPSPVEESVVSPGAPLMIPERPPSPWESTGRYRMRK
ncbi:hypothetical protein J3Q64DRAFT_1734094 [Phycomyces blakesleeanus]|uniref:DUF1206 domain-containing protein n=1 Tax=Phycomyces blakesleeanus TaxID=4837 RepID=A0ABR3B2E3_PHYBL